MPTDPELKDNQIWLNDGPADQPWMSEDIQLNNGTANKDKAAANPTANKVDVTVRFDPKASSPLPEGSTFVYIDLYVGNPNLSMDPSKNVTRLTNPVYSNPNFMVDLGEFTPGNGHVVTKTFNWTLPSTPPANPKDPQREGHRCLIVRAYSDAQNPNSTKFFPIVDERHVAQRNICIINCSSPCGQPIETALPEELEMSEQTLIRVIADLKPERRLLANLLPTLEATPGFVRLAEREPPKFWLGLEDFPDARIRDNTRPRSPGCLGSILRLAGRSGRQATTELPSYEADIDLKPGQQTTVNFLTDLEEVEYGEAFIFHIAHIGQNEKERFVRGGLTLVALRTKEGFNKG